MKPIDQGLVSPDGPLTMMVYGEYGCGKTHLAGDMLHTLKQQGNVLYVNVVGEDGVRTLAPFGLDLATEGTTIESTNELLELINTIAAKKMVGVVIDSAQMLEVLAQKKVVGGLDRGAEKYEWGPVKYLFRERLQALRKAAHYVLVTCASQPPSEKAPRITPDLTGDLARTVAGWVDYLGYMTSDATGRKVSFRPRADALTRSRAIHEIPDVTIPKGNGGWAVLLAALKKAMTPEGGGK